MASAWSERNPCQRSVATWFSKNSPSITAAACDRLNRFANHPGSGIREVVFISCKADAETALERVGLGCSSERRFYDVYPHQLSGGQQQRAAIAQAIACEPALLVADEPTASLDVATEAQILGLFRELKGARTTSLLFITHNPELLRNFADRVAVLYAGRIVETVATERLFGDARHPYSKGLIACTPRVEVGRTDGKRLHAIRGLPPDPAIVADGCSFAPRCTERLAECETRRPEMREVKRDEGVECLLYER